MLNYIFNPVVVNPIQTYNQGKNYRFIYIYRHIPYTVVKLSQPNKTHQYDCHI